MMNARVNNIINAIASEFHRNFDVNATLLLFGSRANNTAIQYSDIDLAIDSKAELHEGKLLKFKDFIDDFPTLYGIDLVDMNAANAQLKKQIELNNRVL
jgi:predicted nucleotidyltransferase